MTNEKAKKELEALLNMCDPSPFSKELEDSLKMAIKALEQQPCIEDYPTCTECEHYDKEKRPNCGAEMSGGGEDGRADDN